MNGERRRVSGGGACGQHTQMAHVLPRQSSRHRGTHSVDVPLPTTLGWAHFGSRLEPLRSALIFDRVSFILNLGTEPDAAAKKEIVHAKFDERL